MSGWLAAIIGAVVTIAVVGAVWLIVWLVRRRRAARRKSPAWARQGGSRGAQEIERLFRDAEDKLRRSPDFRNFGIRDLPVYLLVGDQGSGKTSLILNSGLQSESLAGQNRQGASVESTETLNIWLINSCIVIEASSRIWKDDALAVTLLRKLRYPPLRMIFSRGQNAPRAVIACIPADLLGPGGGLATTVTPLNDFLLLASQQLGIALPVYAVLTRSDAIPGFREIFFNLKPDEATEVLGASLDADQLADRATYSEIAQSTLNDACKKLITFLQTRRTSLLVREYELKRAWAAYEFPRGLEIRRGSLVRALADLCNPSLIQTSPVLRGFYFTGVRRTLRQEGSSMPSPALNDINDPLSATRIIRQGMFPPQAPAAPPATAEEVDEWAFSRRLLRDVIFADQAAVSVSGDSRFREIYRAALCWVGAGLFFVLVGGELVSYVRNSKLERSLAETGDAVRQVEAATPAGLLQPLGKYMEPVVRLIDYRDNVPMSMRWGLYEGSSLFPPAQRLFCTDTKRAVVTAVVRAMEHQLAQGKSTGDYDSLYRMLKAELMMSSDPDKADPDFLTAELVSQAASGGQIAHGAEALVEPILRTYSRLLSMPEQREYCLVGADPAIIRQARAYLRDANAEDKIYSNLKATAGRGVSPVDYNRIHPNDAVHESLVVPGEFTAAAWSRMQGLLDQPDKLVPTETWVLGPMAAAPMDPRVLSARLRARYAAEYAGKWRDYLSQGAVARYAGLDDAGKKLELITSGGNQSALLWLFHLATRNTSVGEPVTSLFQPVREVVAKPDDFSAGLPYLQQLIGIKVPLQSAAHQTGPAREEAFGQVRAAAQQARKAVDDMALKFTTDVGPLVKTVLLEPIVQLDELLSEATASEVAGAGAGLCPQYTTIYSKFPFSPEAQTAADPETVLELIKANEGPAWKYYSSSLTDSLDLGPSGFTAKVNPKVPLRKEFIQFIQRVWEQNRIFYAMPDDPGFNLTLRAPAAGVVKSIDVDIDGTRSHLVPGGSARINWSLRRSQQLQLDVVYSDGTHEQPQVFRGPWALMKWLDSAENPSTQPLEWIVRIGRTDRMIGPARMEYKLNVSLPDGKEFDFRNLKGTRCVPATAAK